MMTQIFFDSNNNFQWASITAFIALIGVLTTVFMSFYTTKKSINAQIKSATRITWINKIIELSATLIGALENAKKNSYDILIYVKEETGIYVSQSNTDEVTPALKKLDNLGENRQLTDLSSKITNTVNSFNENAIKIRYVSAQLKLYFMDDKKAHSIYTNGRLQEIT